MRSIIILSLFFIMVGKSELVFGRESLLEMIQRITSSPSCSDNERNELFKRREENKRCRRALDRTEETLKKVSKDLRKKNLTFYKKFKELTQSLKKLKKYYPHIISFHHRREKLNQPSTEEIQQYIENMRFFIERDADNKNENIFQQAHEHLSSSCEFAPKTPEWLVEKLKAQKEKKEQEEEEIKRKQQENIMLDNALAELRETPEQREEKRCLERINQIQEIIIAEKKKSLRVAVLKLKEAEKKEKEESLTHKGIWAPEGIIILSSQVAHQTMMLQEEIAKSKSVTLNQLSQINRIAEIAYFELYKNGLTLIEKLKPKTTNIVTPINAQLSVLQEIVSISLEISDLFKRLESDPEDFYLKGKLQQKKDEMKNFSEILQLKNI